MRRTMGMGAGMLALLCAACSSPDRPDPVDVSDTRPEVPERAPEKGAAYTPADCFIQPPPGYAADCGWVTVPEAPDSERDIELAVMVLYSSSEVPNDPVVYLEGGPGGSGLSVVATEPFVFEHILSQRDLVLIDQRGTGYSDPWLMCPEDIEATVDEALESLRTCRDTWQGRGVDLGQYNTRQNASDIERVRAALGYAEWNVYGISYGSRLALTVVRDYPEHVRALMIDGVLPLQADLLASATPSSAASLQAVNAGCQAQADCAAAYADIVSKLFESVDRLEAEPAPLDLGGSEPFLLSGRVLLAFMLQLLYAAEIIPYLPAIVSDIHAENYQIFEVLLAGTTSGREFASGMYYSVTCQDEAPFTTREAIDLARADLDARYQLAFDANSLLDVCQVWGVPAAPAAENEVAVGSVPALVTSGAFDPVTPPEFGELASQGLENAQVFVLPNESHGATLGSCGKRLLQAFLEDPNSPVSVDCFEALMPPGYIVGRTGLRSIARVHFEVAPIWDDAVKDRLERALERARRLGRLPPLPASH